MTNTTIATSAATIATISTDYSKSVARMSVESLIKLTHSKEFRNAYGPFAKAKNQKAFMNTAIERLEDLIVTGKVPVEFRTIEGLNRSIAIVEKAIKASLSGMIKLPKTPEQAKARELISSVEKAVAMSKLANRMVELASSDNEAMRHIVLDSQLSGVWFGVRKYALELTSSPVADLKELAAVATNMNVYAEFRKSFADLKATLEFMSKTRVATGTVPGYFVSQAYNGLTVGVTIKNRPAMAQFFVGRYTSQESVSITAETFSDANLKAISRVLLITKTGAMHRYNVSKHGDYGLNLADVCRGNELGLLEVMAIMSSYNVEFSSMLADDRNFCVLHYHTYTYTCKKTEKEKRVEMFKIADNAFELATIRKLNTDGKFWGISNPDTLHKGLIRAIWSTPGFAQLSTDGVYDTMAGLANKMVARAIKLVKQGEEVILPKVLVVINTNGNKRVVSALSTGTVHTSESVWTKHGQCRITSTADKGGIKGTFGPLELLDKDLAVKGYTLLSFGSLKSNMYGIQQLTGTEYQTVEELPTKLIKLANCGKTEIEVMEVEMLPVTITNNYTIQGYRPHNRNALLQDWDMSTEAMAERATAKISVLQEDNVFVEYIQRVRDEEFSGDLALTLEALLVRGDIKPKAKTVGITSSEYDTMTMCHGKAKSIEWMNNLLLDDLNFNDAAKDLQFKRAFQVAQGNYPSSTTKVIALQDFYAQYNNTCKENGIDPKNTLGSYVSRDLLVDLCTGVFGDEGQYEWLKVVAPDNKTVCILPLGELMYGSFADQSTVVEEKVAVTGFISKVFKHIAYSAGAVSQGRFQIKYFQNFAKNIRNEVLAEVNGKSLGKLTATGLYGVLSPSWWSTNQAKVTLTSAKSYSKSNKALVAKHPLLFDMSLAGVVVDSSFPSFLTEGLDAKLIAKMEIIFGNTVFVHEDMLLSLQNDCDGDLVRLSWHDGISFPLFEAKTLDADAIGSTWFNDYANDEKAFDKVKAVKWSHYTVDEVADAMGGAKYAKDCIAIFTNNAQLFAQRCEVDLGLSKDDVRYHAIHRILNIWVQEFSMNAVKHKASSGATLLPEYYLVSTLKFNEMTGTEMNPGQIELLEWLAGKDMDMADHGFKNNLDFARQLHFMLCGIQSRSLGSTLLGKDVRLASIKDSDHVSITGSVQEHFNKDIMQDRLALAYARKLNIA